METLERIARRLSPRQTGDSNYVWNGIQPGDSDTDKLLKLLSDPFSSQTAGTSFLAALIFSLSLSVVLFLLFCFIRPRNNAVYAPRAKHADLQHAPPPLPRGLFGWLLPVITSRELELVDRIGMDAVVFLRFLRMLRNIFVILIIPCVGICIPAATVNSITFGFSTAWFLRMTPMLAQPSHMWAYAVVTYLMDAIILYFIWFNYRAVFKLRRMYFQSKAYQASLHARTLLITDVPKEQRTDESLSLMLDSAKPVDERPKATVGRYVRDLPDLIEEHEETVKQLESILAKYLKDPAKLPAKRPTCKPSKLDRAHSGQKQVDAIDYLTHRVRELERVIKEVRQSVDRRNPESFGFASYGDIANAHSVAYALRKKGPLGSVVRLAPRPHDLIWKNLPIGKTQRKNRSLWISLAMTVLTVVYIVPNVLMAVFLTNFSNLGALWPAFENQLTANPVTWAIIQGIIPPLIQLLIALGIPVVFRRLFNHAGDITKNGRERHVLGRLYGFQTFNNVVVFTIFSTVWSIIASVIKASRDNQDVWETIKKQQPIAAVVNGLIHLSTYWLTFQLQKNLGAAIDLAQLWTLFLRSVQRRFFHPTPRQLIALSAPQPFMYAEYYSQYLVTATIGFCFSLIQPFMAPATAIYLTIEVWFKFYMMQYVCITKTESGGVYWRICINRLLFALILSNATIALVIGSKTLNLAFGNLGSQATAVETGALYMLIPVPFMVWGFKYYCRTQFDVRMAYYSTNALAPDDFEAGMEANGKVQRMREDRVGVRFGHPAMYKKLMTPMVDKKAKAALKEIYRGRLDDDEIHAAEGYSDDIFMGHMSKHKPGKSVSSDMGFEFVAESDADFENFKKRAEFREQFGGDGELYGRPEDMSRPGTPSVYSLGSTAVLQASPRDQSPNGGDSRSSSRTRGPGRDDAGAVYPRGYHSAATGPGLAGRSSRQGSVDIGLQGHPAFRGDYGNPYADEDAMLRNAAGMGHATPSGDSRGSTPRGRGADSPRADYFTVEQHQQGYNEDTSYDSYRRGRY